MAMPMPPPRLPVRYQLSGPVAAVKLEEHPGSSLRNPTNTMVEIPAEAIIELEGAVSASGLINIIWNADAFSIFYEDLTGKSKVVGSS